MDWQSRAGRRPSVVSEYAILAMLGHEARLARPSRADRTGKDKMVSIDLIPQLRRELSKRESSGPGFTHVRDGGHSPHLSFSKPKKFSELLSGRETCQNVCRRPGRTNEESELVCELEFQSRGLRMSRVKSEGS